MEKDVVEINGEKVEFFYTRKKIKNLILKVNKENEIVISLPKRASLNDAKEFITKKYSWIQKARIKHETYDKIKETKEFNEGEILYLFGNPYQLEISIQKENNVYIKDQTICIGIKERYIENKAYIIKVYEEWLKKLAMVAYTEYVDKYQKLMENYNIPYPEIYIRKMKSRWGECFPKKKKIVLNISLIKVPKKCIEYVVVHELAHFKYPNHSKQFYSFVEQFIPEWKERRKALNKEYTRIII